MDVKEWDSISVYDVAGQNFADVGKYKVCFSEGPGLPFSAIPSEKGGLYFEIEAEEGYSLHPRDVFSHQVLSGRIGTDNTLSISGHRLYLPSTSAISIKGLGGCDSELPMVFSAFVDEDMSSPDAYIFPAELPDDILPGTYDLCYCESRNDMTPDIGSGDFMYKMLGVTVGAQAMTGASKCSSTPLPQVLTSDPESAGLLAKDLVAAEFQDHFCAKKCARGCVRQDCFCDSFDPDTMYDESTVDLMAGYAAPLCLSASLCRDACSASPYCEMFDYEPATNFCWLLSATPAASTCESGALNYDESTQTWSKVNGGACTNTTDFMQTVGTITLSRRADIANDWVLTPSAGVGTDYVPVQSLEVTGENMDWKMDRVMLVECTGTCGVSGPAASVRSLVGVGSPGIPSQAAFNAWVAMNDMKDPPAEDEYEEKEKGR